MSKSLLMIILMSSAITLPGCLGTVGIEVDKGTIRILTYDIYALSDSVISDFEKETGYEVVFIKQEDGGAVLETALQTMDSPIADLIIGIDNSFLQIALDHELYQESGITLPSIHPQASAPYSGSLAIPYDWGKVCFNIDSGYADGENVSMPTSLWDLTGEDWKGKVAVQNPRTSTPGRAFLAATVDYFENDADNSTDYSDWWSAMNDNDIIITNGWSESYLQYYEAGYGVWDDSFIGGAHAAVSYCHSPGAEAYWGGGVTNSVALNISGASFLQVEYAGIASGPGVNIEGATVFLELLLSNSIQSTIPETNVMYPALSHLSIPEGVYSDHTAEPVDAIISMQRIATEMHGWLNEWDLSMA